MNCSPTHRTVSTLLPLWLCIGACEPAPPESDGDTGTGFRAALDPTDHNSKWDSPLPTSCLVPRMIVRSRSFGHTQCVDGELSECAHRERVTLRCTQANPARWQPIVRHWESSNCVSLGQSCTGDAVTCADDKHWCSQEYDVHGCVGSHWESCDGDDGGSSATAFGPGEGGSDTGGSCSAPPSPWELLQDCQEDL